MVVIMAYAGGGQPFGGAEGEYLEIDPDTLDTGKQFFAKAYGVNNGEEWLLWSAPDNRPVGDRAILGQKTAAGWDKIHNVTLL